MKRILVPFFIIVLSVLTACSNTGKTNNAEVDYGNSVKFTETEIKSAIDTVLIKFKDFNGCDLKKIWYDEELSDRNIQMDISSGGGNTIKNSGAEPKNIIILFSDFYVDSFGGDGSFNPDYTYTDWNWILIRNSENDKWKVYDWGY